MNESLDPPLPVSAPGINEEHPWPGLAHYAEADHRYFFGREEQVEMLVRSTRRTPLTILYGTSGRGKSSIIGAGLIHQLKLAGHGVTLLRRDYDTLSEEPLVARVIQLASEDHHFGDVDLPARDQTLWQFFHDRSRPWCAKLDGSRALDLPPVLIFDQFEEIFSKGEDHPTDRRARAWARKFLKQLANLVENRPPASLSRRLKRCKGEERQALLDRYDFESQPVRVVLVLRADYLARLERLRAVMPSLMQQRIELPDLTGEQALAAAFRPGALRPEQPPIISEEIAAQVVRCAANVPDSTPLKDIASVPASILNLLCNELNEGRGQVPNQKPCVTEFTSRAADGIMRAFYEKRMARHHRVRPVLERLLAPNGNREAPLVQTVLAELARVPDARKQILEDLPNERILVVERSGRAERIEFTHDKLAEFAKNSADARAASARFRRGFLWTAAAAVVIAGIALWTTVQQKRTEEARESAELQKKQADDLANTLAGQRKVMIQELHGIGANLGTAPTVEDEYEDIYQVLDRVRVELAKTKGQESELMQLEGVVANGQAWGALNRSNNKSAEDAENHYQKAVEIWENLTKEKPGDAELYQRLGYSSSKLAEVIMNRDAKAASEKYGFAARAYDKAAELEAATPAPNQEWSHRTYRINTQLSQIDSLTAAGDYAEAEKIILETEKLLSETFAAMEAGRYPPNVTKTGPGSGLLWRKQQALMGLRRANISTRKFEDRLSQVTPSDPTQPLPYAIPEELRAELRPLVEEATKNFESSIAAFVALEMEVSGDGDIPRHIGMQQAQLGDLWARFAWDSTEDDRGKKTATLLDEAAKRLSTTTEHTWCWTAAFTAAQLWLALGGPDDLSNATQSAVNANAAALRGYATVPTNDLSNASESAVSANAAMHPGYATVPVDDLKRLEWAGNCVVTIELSAMIYQKRKLYAAAAVDWGNALTGWENFYLNRTPVDDSWLERAIQCATSLAHAQRRHDSFDPAAAEASMLKAVEFAGRIKSEQMRNQWVATCQARLEQARLLRELNDSVNFAAAALNNGPQDTTAQQHTVKARELMTDLQTKLATTPDNATAIWVLPFEAAILNLEGTVLVHSNKLSEGEKKFTEGLAIFKELGADTPLVFTNFEQNLLVKLDWVKALKADASTKLP
jgi:hypothetical protein